jgi:hypothetical protein
MDHTSFSGIDQYKNRLLQLPAPVLHPLQIKVTIFSTELSTDKGKMKE